MQHRPAHAVSAQLRLEPDHQENAGQPQQHRRRNQLPAQAGKKDHRQAGRQHQQRGAQVRLLHDQAHRHHQQQTGHQVVKRAQLALAFLEPPGQHQRHRNFQDFAGLDHDAQVDPAFRAFFRDAKNRHGDQQGHAQHIQGHGKRHQALRRDLRHDKHDAPGNQHVAAVVHKPRAVVEAGRIHDHQAGTGQQENGKRQRAVKALEHRGGALEKGRFIENGGHEEGLSASWCWQVRCKGQIRARQRHTAPVVRCGQ